MLHGRPLFDTQADDVYFVAPRVWDPLLRALERENNILVSGSRGAGKTTVLRRLQRALRTADQPAAFVPAGGLADATELLERIRAESPARLSPESGLPAPSKRARGGLLGNLDALRDVEPCRFLVDASGSVSAVYDLFGRLRDALWELPHRWLVAVDETERATALRAPADAFFDTVIGLEAFSPAELSEILRRRAVGDELSEAAIGAVLAGAGGNPRTALRAANDAVVHGIDPTAAGADRALLLDRASALGRSHGLLMAELLDLGRASPSDKALQNRLGLTRARVTALLRDLLDEALVATETDRSGQPGRPRTIYVPREPESE